MKPHKGITERLRAQVTEFLFRGMHPTRHRDFDDHLQTCEVCRAEAASQRGLAEQLGFVAPARPSRQKRAAVRQPWQSWRPAPLTKALTFVAGGPEGFEPTAYPGITAKRLFVDVPNDRVTMVVHMASGSSYPAHRHAGPEECFVLEGDLKAGPVTMRAGDYQRADAGSHHPVQATDSGCLLFIVSSLHDEIQA